MVASCPACLLNSPASRSYRNRFLHARLMLLLEAGHTWAAVRAIDKRIIAVQLVTRRASWARPLRLAALWLSSIRSASVSTMVFFTNTIILPFQLSRSTRAYARSGERTCMRTDVKISLS